MAFRGLSGACAGLAIGLALVGCGDSGGTSGSGGGTGTGGAGGTGGSGGGTLGPGFACLGSVELATTTDTTVDAPIIVENNLSAAKVDGVAVKLCERSDLACAAPASQATTDAMGVADLTFPLGPTGFDGYGLGTKSGFLPTIWVQSIPILPPGQGFTVPFFDEASVSLAAQAYGVTIDTAKGTVAVNVYDCDGANAEGAVLSMDVSSESIGYATEHTPDPSRTSTDAFGGAFALNVAPGMAHLVVKMAATGQTLGEADVPVLAGGVTQVYFFPTP